MSRESLVRLPRTRWIYRDADTSILTVIGDAVHSMTPAGGIGAVSQVMLRALKES